MLFLLAPHGFLQLFLLVWLSENEAYVFLSRVTLQSWECKFTSVLSEVVYASSLIDQLMPNSHPQRILLPGLCSVQSLSLSYQCDSCENLRLNDRCSLKSACQPSKANLKWKAFLRRLPHCIYVIYFSFFYLK